MKNLEHQTVDEQKRRQHGHAYLLRMLSCLTMVVVLCYACVRTFLFIQNDYNWYENLITGSLLFGEGFLLLHSIGYFMNVVRVLKAGGGERIMPQGVAELEEYPPVAITVSAYKEPLRVVEDNLICFRNLTYPNKHIYFLDDTRYDLPNQDEATREAMKKYRQSIDNLCREIGVNLFRRKWHGAKAGMINDFLDFTDGEQREGFEFSHFDGVPRLEKEKYIIVFDADMNPLPDFVEDLVKVMEEHPNMAFIQTPQYYTNFEANRVARAAGQQQAIFYEYICEGKSLQDAMFCCGTNVMFRREALMAVGGFDDTSVTEDFATSMKFHSAGWDSAYMGKVAAFGMGPQELVGYFKQQFRWAVGTIGQMRKLIPYFIRKPRDLTPARWWEYFLSSTYYLAGFVFFILLMCPVLYLFFGIPRYFAYPEIFLVFFTPYIALTMMVFILSMKKRNYRTMDILTGLLLSSLSFPVYMKASVQGLMGYKGSFGITPKDGSSAAPLSAIWPQLTGAAVCFAAVVWGLNDIYYSREINMGVAANSVWCLYHFILLSAIVYFNRPDETEPF